MFIIGNNYINYDNFCPFPVSYSAASGHLCLFTFPTLLKKIGAKCNYFRNNSYLCSIARLAHLWAAGGLIYEKDVFERLSL